ncbi:MAG: CBS domain-containing protein [Novosphingobium sp.]
MTIARVIASRPDPEVITCNADSSVRDAIAILAERRIGALPVTDGDGVIGIFSERDVIYCLASAGGAALDRSVREVMTAPAITVAPDTEVLTALALMTRRRIRHLPVTQEGRTVGFVSIGDLVKHRIERIEADAEAMRAYIQTA